MKKEIWKLILFVCTFVVFVFCVVLVFLVTKQKNNGNLVVNSSYANVIFTDVNINFETDSYLKIDNENKVIKVFIRDLNDFKKENSFFIDMLNIGNEDIVFDNYEVIYVKTNDDKDNTVLDVVFNGANILTAGERKNIKIEVKYNGKLNNNPYYIAEIKFNFKDSE